MADATPSDASQQVQAMSDDVLRELQAAVAGSEPAVAPVPEEAAVALSARGARIMQIRDETLADVDAIAEAKYWKPRHEREAEAAKQAAASAEAERQAKIESIKQSLNQPAA